jgi:phospholipid transport system substrate-binding protein
MNNMMMIKENFFNKRTCTIFIVTSCLLFSLSFSQMAKAVNSVDKILVEKSIVTQKKVDQSNPYTMVQGTAEQTFKRFANEHKAIRENPNVLKDIVREELMPYINYKYSAFKVIGKHLKKTTDAERRAFIPVFREYLVSSYAQVFTLYDNQTVEFAPEKPFVGKKIVAVNTRIIMSGRDNIDVSFKVRLNKKTKQWQAFDMVAEGVSLLDSKQAELGSLIRQKGLPYVTELLKSKSAKDIVFKGGNSKRASSNKNVEQQG